MIKTCKPNVLRLVACLVLCTGVLTPVHAQDALGTAALAEADRAAALLYDADTALDSLWLPQRLADLSGINASAAGGTDSSDAAGAFGISGELSRAVVGVAGAYSGGDGQERLDLGLALGRSVSAAVNLGLGGRVISAGDGLGIGATLGAGYTRTATVGGIANVDVGIAFLGSAVQSDGGSDVVPRFAPYGAVRTAGGGWMPSLALAIDLADNSDLRIGTAANWQIGTALGLRVAGNSTVDGTWTASAGVHVRLGNGRHRFALRTAAADGQNAFGGSYHLQAAVPDRQAPVLAAPQLGGAAFEQDVLGLTPAGAGAVRELVLAATDNREIASIEASVWDDDDREVWHRRLVPPAGRQGGLREALAAPLLPVQIAGQVLLSSDALPEGGRYRLSIVAIDAAGNRSQAFERTVDFDTEPPRVSLDLRSGLTPDAEDGRPALQPGAVLNIQVDYDDAIDGRVALVDAVGGELFTLAGDVTTNNLDWNGLDPDGGLLRPGIYQIAAFAVDDAGNEATLVSESFRVVGIDPRVTVRPDADLVSLRVDPDAATVRLALEPLVFLDAWQAQVLGPDGTVRAETDGIDAPPAEFSLAPFLNEDGQYTVVLQASWGNATLESRATASFELDNTAPTLSAVLSAPRVRLGQDSQVSVFLETREAYEVQVTVVAPDGTRTTIYDWGEVVDAVDWNLVVPASGIVGPGTWSVSAAARDRAGNVTTNDRLSLAVLAPQGAVAVAWDADVFSPNGDGRQDSAQIFVQSDAAIALDIVASDNQPVRRLSATGAGTLVWDGRDNAGRPVADGVYALRVIDRDDATDGARIEIDTRPPVVRLAANRELVSPDGDQRFDNVRLSWGSEGETTLRLLIDNESGRVADLAPPTSGVDWRPQDAAGSTLADGTYQLTLFAQDRAGNRATSDPITLRIDSRPALAFLNVDNVAISPNGDGIADAAVATLRSSLPNAVVAWSLRAQSENRSVELATGTDNLPQQFDLDGELIADGVYTLELEIEHEHGPIARSTFDGFRVDRQPPSIRVTQEPQLFSPDGDGLADILRLGVEWEDLSAIRFWYLEIFDPFDNLFFDRGAEGPPPAELAWDGRADDGELVAAAQNYPYRLTMEDVLGNRSVYEATIGIDVLVEPFGDGFRIRIPSITFLPNLAQLDLAEDTEAGRTNRFVLERLAEILQRFPDYTIQVEGHAVNLSGTEREETEELLPLSRARAQTVVDALVDSGIPRRQLAALGRGGRQPVVPHSDLGQRWKNRRVDFILRR